MNKSLKNVLVSFVVGAGLTGISYAVGMYFQWITELNWIEVASVFLSYSCVYLCVVQSRWNYPIGALAGLALMVLYYQAGLLASAALQIYLIPVLVYGFLRWGPDKDTRPVRSLTSEPLWALGYLFVTAATYAGFYAINQYLGGILAPMDTAILVLSILAQYLLDNKRVETWAIWAIVNVISIYTYWNAELYLVAFQFMFFLANTLLGTYKWYRTLAPRADIIKVNI